MWTRTTLDSNSKMILSWELRGRSSATAIEFMDDLRSRLANRVLITTDGHKAYLEAVESAFGADVDYAKLMKQYSDTSGKSSEKRYGPADCTGIKKRRVEGSLVTNGECTSHIGRHNLPMRVGMRRFTRLKNAFSKMIENHLHMLSLYSVH